MSLEKTVLKIRGHELILGRKTFIVGILNATPDSFSDGGQYMEMAVALERIEEMLSQGASIIDIGGESTRPGFAVISEKEELRRVLPIIEASKEEFPELPISIDTTKSGVTRKLLQIGVDIVNDISGFREDPAMAESVADAEASCILMHNARLVPISSDTLGSIKRYWEDSLSRAEKAGIERDRIILDPGIGFGTTREQDLEILRNIAELKAFGFPLMIGASKKRITGDLLDLSLQQRKETTLATTVCAAQGGADFVRVHDVLENARAAAMADLIYRKYEG